SSQFGGEGFGHHRRSLRPPSHGDDKKELLVLYPPAAGDARNLGATPCPLRSLAISCRFTLLTFTLPCEEFRKQHQSFSRPWKVNGHRRACEYSLQGPLAKAGVVRIPLPRARPFPSPRISAGELDVPSDRQGRRLPCRGPIRPTRQRVGRVRIECTLPDSQGGRGRSGEPRQPP